MKTNRRATAIFASVILALGATIGIAVAATSRSDQPTAPEQNTPSQRIQEDDPAWDCTTMGNLICGPTQAPPVRR